MKIFPSLLLLALLIGGFFACSDDDNFSSGSGLKLEFSKDTVSFDTVFTDIGTSYKKLMVYNRNKNSLTISSVKIMNPEKSNFNMLVDGFSGTEINDVDILKKDSVYIHIVVKVDPNNSDNPIVIRDSIQFNVNGSIQYVQLEAVGQDVHIWRGKTINKDTTLIADKPILVYDSLIVANNTTLNIEKNVKLFFHNKAGIKVFGKINAKGTALEPIIFRGDRTDRIFENVPYDRIPGQWEGMTIDSLSFDNHFEHFHLRNSINGIFFNPSNLSAKKATFKNSIVHNTQYDVVNAQNCDIYAENSLFTNAGGIVMKLVGGKYEFIHCTLSNNQAWRGMGHKETLYLANETSDKRHTPLIQCNFYNSIVAGNSNAGDITLRENKDVAFQHMFKNCLFRTGGEDDENFTDSVWKTDPKFKNINNDKDQFYDFSLDSISPAINKGDLGIAFRLPLDMNGNSRITDEGPDLGCYEWIKSGD